MQSHKVRSAVRSRASIEPLEARIAPAVLVNGPNLLGGSGNPNIGEMSLGDNSVTLVKVNAGQVLVWYNDGDISSVSFSDGASFELIGNVGDIVGNLGSDGRLSDSDHNPINGDDGNILLGNSLAGLKVTPFGNQRGDVHSVVTGGSISNVSITGELHALYAGDGAFNAASDAVGSGGVSVKVGFDTNPLLAGDQANFIFTAGSAVLKPGASVKNVVVGIGKELEIITGSGAANLPVVPTAAGVAGGNIENVVLKSAIVDLSSDPSVPSYHLVTGAGGAGKTGGAGGSILNITDEASLGLVVLAAGDGGPGLGGKGGEGGSIRIVEMQSDSARYELTAGHGGAGAPGGAGGSVISGNFSNLSPAGGIIRSADFTGDGAEDLLIVDASSGNMVIMENDGTGTNFTPHVQYHDLLTNEAVIAISSFGSTVSDVVVADVDGDGDQDIAIAYKNSNNLAVVFNVDGQGSFWNPAATIPGWSSSSTELAFSPAFIAPAALGGSAALDFIAVENLTNKAVIHGLVSDGTGEGDLKYGDEIAFGEFGSPATDLVTTQSGGLKAFVGFKNGHVAQLRLGSFVDAGLILSSGVSGLDLSDDGSQLLALGSDGRSLAVIGVAGNGFTQQIAPTITGAGRGVVAEFVHDADPLTSDKVAILMSAGGSARIDLYAPSTGVNPGDPVTWSSTTAVTSASPLKNFVAAYTADSSAFGYATLGGAVNHFTFTTGGVSDEYALPFSGKQVFITAGDGGQGLDLGSLLGKGGAGGSVTNVNIIATDIALIAGSGGNAPTAGGGAGGSITNGASFVTGTGTVFSKLVAESSLSLASGNGGSALGAPSLRGTGGAGGSIAGIHGELSSGLLVVTTGNGGAGAGAAAGAGGSVNHVDLLTRGGNLTLVTGDGGAAIGSRAAGGAGGSVTAFSYTLTLDALGETSEQSYTASLTSGAGGSSSGGAGGAGGTFNGVSIVADPPDRTYDDGSVNPAKVDAHLDSTFLLHVFAGNGGDGTSGGAGGAVRGLNVQIVHDQRVEKRGIFLNYATADVFTGHGGAGSAGNGGAGGDFAGGRFVGLTGYDPDALQGVHSLGVLARDGGAGSLKGGAGGNILGLVAANAQFGNSSTVTNTLVGTNMLADAFLLAGNAGAGGTGDGGKGGDLAGLKVSTQGGRLTAFAGAGGASGSAKGGAGGSVKDSTLAVVSTVTSDAMIVLGGLGGTGATVGGAGGSLLNLNLNGPIGRVELGDQTTFGRPITLVAGDGGDATASHGKAGAGGDVIGITQAKDVFSSISAIIAGNGGDAATGSAGRGGNVQNIRTVGFIGKPTAGDDRLGVFDEDNDAQGIFVGRAGTGSIAAANGSVSNVVARQIAAIAARADSAGLFAAAAKVSNVKADLIGYDVDGDGLFDGATASPATGLAIDGFLFASSVSGVSGQRAAFTFTA